MANSETTSSKLLRLYNEIDAYLRQECKTDKYADHVYLIQEVSRKNRVVARYQQELRAVAQLRNSIVHNPFRDADPIASTNEVVVTYYEHIRDSLLNPQTALSIAIPAKLIYTVAPDENLNQVLKHMDKNTYTHVPVIEDNKMTGILSENTLLSYLAENGDVIITEDMAVKELADYLPISAHRSETFVFLPRKASLGQVFSVFNEAIKKRQRIGMLFITEHGRQDEKPLGIITAWDLASPEFESR